MLRGSPANMDTTFQSTSLLRGTTRRGYTPRPLSKNFNPRPSCEGRPCSNSQSSTISLFQSTSLLRGTTRPKGRRKARRKFQSTSLLRGTTRSGAACAGSGTISIHVPLARDDMYFFASFASPFLFQSTSLLRGTTKRDRHEPDQLHISIHVPLARDDPCFSIPKRCFSDFNPRPSCEGRHDLITVMDLWLNFNPRPSCEGRRRLRWCRSTPARNFNPRPSCEGRLSSRHFSPQPSRNFNPRPSCEGRLRPE